MPCWNPSGSSRFNIDTTALMDPNQYCQPPPEAPYCTTSTWQYSTKDFFGSSTSHWIGINRGCATSRTTSATGAAASGNNRAVSGLLENIRLYLPTNTAAQARDNARYHQNEAPQKMHKRKHLAFPLKNKLKPLKINKKH